MYNTCSFPSFCLEHFIGGGGGADHKDTTNSRVRKECALLSCERVLEDDDRFGVESYEYQIPQNAQSVQGNLIKLHVVRRYFVNG